MRSRDDALSVTVKVFLLLVMAFMFAMALYGCGKKESCRSIYEGQIANTGYVFEFEEDCGYKPGDIVLANAGNYGYKYSKILKIVNYRISEK